MDPNDSNSEPPGKLRTWWHPILVGLLSTRLSDSCEVQGEVSLGRMPLRLDILLIRRLSVELPEIATIEFRAICQRLNAYTMIEFKSPMDVLSRGDWNKLAAYANLYVSQSNDGIPADKITLMILAPQLSGPFRDGLAQSGCTLIEEEPGIHQIAGGAFLGYVVETDRVAGLAEPALTLFSREFLEHRREFVGLLRDKHEDIVYYVMQQIESIRQLMPNFEDSHMAEQMNQTYAEIETAMLKRMTPEQRMQGLPVKERLKGVPKDEIEDAISEVMTPEQRIRGLPLNEIVKNFSDEEIANTFGVEALAKLRNSKGEPSSK